MHYVQQTQTLPSYTQREMHCFKRENLHLYNPRIFPELNMGASGRCVATFDRVLRRSYQEFPFERTQNGVHRIGVPIGT